MISSAAPLLHSRDPSPTDPEVARALARISPAGLGLVVAGQAGRWRLWPHIDFVDRVIVDAIAGRGPKRIILEEPPRHGKALAVDTPIPTPDGWRAIGELRAGDRVFDERGVPCRVVARSPVWRDRPVFRVRLDNGDELVADVAHEWRAQLCRKTRAGIHTTEVLARKRGKRALIERAGALELPDRDLPIDPYMLGVWLGDGCSGHATITQGAQDFDEIRELVHQAGYRTSHRATAGTFGVLGLLRPLTDLGLLRNKHLPPVYLRASARQRMALLQGLVDTDGHVAPDGQVEVCTMNRKIADGVRELVHSLGRKASLIEGRATIDGRDCGPKWRVMFYMAGCARLPRKRARTRDVERTPHWYVDAVPCGRADTVCIEVDSPSHLFLAGRSMIPTHNSEHVSRLTPPWFLGNWPDRKVMLASYQAGFAATWGRKGRDILEAYGPALYGVRVRTDARAQDEWYIAGRDGAMYTDGMRGSFTGKGADLLIIDDPIKNQEEAQSEVIREKHWDWWLSTASTRLHPGAVVIVLLTRWHEDDLAGRLLRQSAEEDFPEEEVFHEIRIPALADSPDDPLGRETGEALWPERFDAAWLQRKRRQVTVFWFAAMYQGLPAPAEGNLFKRRDFREFRFVDAGDATYVELLTGDEGQPVRRYDYGRCTRFKTVDVAGSSRETADYTVIATWAITPDADLLLERIERQHFDELDVPGFVSRSLETDPGLIAYVERLGFGSGVIKRLRYLGYPIGKLEADTDKVTRALPAVALLEGHKLFFLQGAAWRGEFDKELATFPNGEHDDQVDVTSYAARKMLALRQGKPDPVPQVEQRRARPTTAGIRSRRF